MRCRYWMSAWRADGFDVELRDMDDAFANGGYNNFVNVWLAYRLIIGPVGPFASEGGIFAKGGT